MLSINIFDHTSIVSSDTFLKLLNEVSQGFEITPSEELKKRYDDAPKVKSYDWFLKNVDPS